MTCWTRCTISSLQSLQKPQTIHTPEKLLWRLNCFNAKHRKPLQPLEIMHMREAAVDQEGSWLASAPAGFKQRQLVICWHINDVLHLQCQSNPGHLIRAATRHTGEPGLGAGHETSTFDGSDKASISRGK